MDLRKFQIFNSGLSEEEKEALAEQETAESKFKENLEKVRLTMRSEGWSIIIERVVAEMEYCRAKLLNCKAKELDALQEKIKLRKEFLDEWTQYIE